MGIRLDQAFESTRLIDWSIDRSIPQPSGEQWNVILFPKEKEDRCSIGIYDRLLQGEPIFPHSQSDPAAFYD